MADNWNENWLKDVSIRNFKSVREVDLTCRRINVFIGEPNVGKSNVLEGIALLNGDIAVPGEKLGLEGIRFENIANLFFEQKFKDLEVEVWSEKIRSGLFWSGGNYSFFTLSRPPSHHENFEQNVILFSKSKELERYDFVENFRDINRGRYNLDIYDQVGPDGNLPGGLPFSNSYATNVFLYRFKPFTENKSHRTRLSPPFGNNLFSIVESYNKLREEVVEFIRPFGYTFVLDPVNEKMSMQKLDGMYAIQTPYSMIADTLQRMIFHYAAIYSNENSVLLFEEPESHSFPPYIDTLAERIVASETNQFFMTTHSPFILDKMISYSSSESVAIHFVYYDDGETKARTLSDEKIQEIVDDGVDVFFNLDWLKD